jgi:tripartite-type tricarboxylate transporter receptor subunit TctC
MTQTPFGISRRTAVFALPLMAAGLAAPVARAQAKYPDHPVRVILPFGPGGVADVTARLVAQALSEKLGQNFFIENMPGAGGITAARAALAGGTDGYTLTLLTNGTAISVPLFTHLPFDPLKEFVPISTIGYFTCDFVVNASSPYQTLGDFLKAAKAKPGTLNVGTINVGSTQNLTAELFKAMAGIDVVIVPFRSSPDVVVALLRDDIQMDIDFMPRSSRRSTAARRAPSPPARRSARRNCRTFRPCKKAALAISRSRRGTGFTRRRGRPTPSSKP